MSTTVGSFELGSMVSCRMTTLLPVETTAYCALSSSISVVASSLLSLVAAYQFHQLGCNLIA